MCRHEGKDFLKVLNFDKFELEFEFMIHHGKGALVSSLLLCKDLCGCFLIGMPFVTELRCNLPFQQGRMSGKKAAIAKFKELDADRSGYLRGAEMKELAMWVHNTGFDGATQAERQMRGQQLGKQIMQRLDANGDGRLQFDEFQAWFLHLYKHDPKSACSNQFAGITSV